MVKTTTETYCDHDETIEFFSEFYSYCAERLKMKTTTTTTTEKKKKKKKKKRFHHQFWRT